ncbi:hypothetical protein ACFLU6_15365 [Acidobacteriota bacterium]
MLKGRQKFLLLILALAALGLIAGCSRQAQEQSQGEEKKLQLRSVDDAEVRAKLAKADLVDGTADKVVTKCGACALNMEGSHEHTASVSGYTLQFCSAHCKDSFTKDVNKSILALNLPGE